MEIKPTYNSGIQLRFGEGYLVIHELSDGRLQIVAPKSTTTLLSTRASDYVELDITPTRDGKGIVISVPDQSVPDF